jgi:hypothetical protein
MAAAINRGTVTYRVALSWLKRSTFHPLATIEPGFDKKADPASLNICDHSKIT